MLTALRTEWEALQNRNASASEMAAFYSEAVTTIRDQIIPNFFVNEYDRIHEIIHDEPREACELRSLDLPYKEMAEYEIGVNQYVQSMLEKANSEEFDSEEWISDVQKVKHNSLSFVQGLFEDELNPCHRVPVTEAMGCIESLMDLQTQCDAMLETGETIGQQLELCKEDTQRDELANLYYQTETRFLLEYTQACLTAYNAVTDVLSGKTGSESIQLL